MTKYTRTLVFAAAMLAAAAPLGAQHRGRRHRSDEEGRNKIDTTISVSRAPTVDLSLMSGEIKVTSWDKNEIRIVATSEDGDLRLEASQSRVSLSVDEDGGDGDTQYEVTVPKTARVIAGGVSGDVSIRGVADVQASSVSGDVTVSAISGRAEIQTVSGELHASDLGGEVRATNVSGDIEIAGVAGELAVNTVSGEMKLRGVKSSYVRTETVSGDVEFEGTVDPKGRYEFHSHSGSFTITVPRGTGATVSMRSFSGELSSSCEMVMAPGKPEGGRTILTLGGGGARFTIETFSGDVQIKGCGSTTKSKED